MPGQRSRCGTNAQAAAIAERIETDPMRRLDLELLAG